MKSIIICLVVSVSAFGFISCKTKKLVTSTGETVSAPINSNATADKEITNTTASTPNQGANAGKVSHKYRETGCETVIIILAHDDVAEITLIPKDKLNKDIDMDGQTITFDYQPLKMPQPAGCTVGIPAEISNITKMK